MKNCCKDNQEDNTFEAAMNKENKKNYLDTLKEKWQLKSILQVVIVLIIFTLGGSTCAYLARTILGSFNIENRAIYITIYIISATILWPICVLFYSILLGQYSFFSKYLKKLGKRMIGKK